MSAEEEKAKELIDKYLTFKWATYPRAKNCALICVDEILKLNTWVDALYQRDNPTFADEEDTEEYWQKVKEIIQSK